MLVSLLLTWNRFHTLFLCFLSKLAQMQVNSNWNDNYLLKTKEQRSVAAVLVSSLLILNRCIQKLSQGVILSSSCSHIFCKVSVLKRFAKSTGKKVVPEYLLNKVAGLQRLITKVTSLQEFSGDFAMFLRSPH